MDSELVSIPRLNPAARYLPLSGVLASFLRKSPAAPSATHYAPSLDEPLPRGTYHSKKQRLSGPCRQFVNFWGCGLRTSGTNREPLSPGLFILRLSHAWRHSQRKARLRERQEERS